MAASVLERRTAVVLVTDGMANGLVAANGSIRAAEGYLETRWPEWVGPVPHSTADIEAQTQVDADALGAAGVDLWVLVVGTGPPYLVPCAQGAGTYRAAATGLVQPALAEIAAEIDASRR